MAAPHSLAAVVVAPGGSEVMLVDLQRGFISRAKMARSPLPGSPTRPTMPLSLVAEFSRVQHLKLHSDGETHNELAARWLLVARPCRVCCAALSSRSNAEPWNRPQLLGLYGDWFPMPGKVKSTVGCPRTTTTRAGRTIHRVARRILVLAPAAFPTAAIPNRRRAWG